MDKRLQWACFWLASATVAAVVFFEVVVPVVSGVILFAALKSASCN